MVRTTASTAETQRGIWVGFDERNWNLVLVIRLEDIKTDFMEIDEKIDDVHFDLEL